MLCGHCAVMLFWHHERVRSRLFMGAMVLFWAMIYLVLTIGVGLGHGGNITEGILQPAPIILGTSASIFVLGYVIELFRSGWLTVRRALLLLSPFIGALSIYGGVLALRGEPIEQLPDGAALRASFFHFNVWFRLPLLAISFAYVLPIFILFYRWLPSFRRRSEEDFSSPEQLDIRWGNVLVWGMALVMGIYYYLLFTGREAPYLLHHLIVIPYFIYITNKALFQQSPFPAGFFRHTLNLQAAEEEEIEEEQELLPDAETNDTAFTAKIEEYKATFDEWMRTEKPYLRPEFNRTDLSHRMGLNRTYFSRLFRQGYGQTFSQVVRRYRVEEARRLICEDPRLTSKELATRCGFSSHIVFHRAFAEVTGMTPLQYKEEGKCE